jgi:hypothetical protein
VVGGGDHHHRGYGDQYPVTAAGRKIGVVVRFAGVGIIGALASIFASLLIPPQTTSADRDQVDQAPPALHDDLAQIRSELAALRELIDVDSTKAPR